MITKDYIKSAPRHVFIMVGIPGSGKSTTAKKITHLAEEIYEWGAGEVVSADNFFMHDGEYKFDPSKLGDAHKACMRHFLNLVMGGLRIIVVDNTNLSIESMAAFAAVAHVYDYSVTLVFHHISAEESFKRNTHGVPLAKCQQMFGQFEYLVGKKLRNTPVKAVFNLDREGNDFDPLKF